MGTNRIILCINGHIAPYDTMEEACPECGDMAITAAYVPEADYDQDIKALTETIRNLETARAEKEALHKAEIKRLRVENERSLARLYRLQDQIDDEAPTAKLNVTVRVEVDGEEVYRG